MILDEIFGLGSPARRNDFSFEAARRDRTTADRWADAKDVSVNAWLLDNLSTLRGRAMYEFINNGMVKGIVKTFRDDIAGSTGPKLSVQSDDPEFNEKLESTWREWWRMPDINGQMSGVDILAMSFTQVFTAGDYLWQIVDDPDAESEIRTRIMMIHPRRLSSPMSAVADSGILMGVKRTPTGKPVSYFIEEPPKGDGIESVMFEHAEVAAHEMIHGFERLEPDQVRGVPWLTTALPVIANIRDFKQSVREAARMAAMLGVLLFTKDATGDPVEWDEAVELEGGTMKTLPPNYDARMITPQQPQSNYAEFLREEYREMGRPIGMPNLTTLLDAKGHSWSSARLDRDVYHAGLKVEQARTGRTGLNRLVDAIRREGELTGLVPLRRGLRVRYIWTWPAFGTIDEVKSAKAATERMVNGTSSQSDECAAIGKDWEEVNAQRELEKRDRAEKGIEIKGDVQQGRGKRMEELARAVRAGVPIAVSEARGDGLGLAAEPPGDSVLLRFNDQDILQYHIESGLLTINEARGRLNLPAVPWGDVPVRRQGIVVVDPNAKPEPGKPATGGGKPASETEEPEEEGDVDDGEAEDR